MTQVIRTSLSDMSLHGVDEFAEACEISRGEALDFLVTVALIQMEKEIQSTIAREKAIARKDKMLSTR